MGLRELLTAEKHSEIKPLIQQSFPYVYSTEKTEDCIERLKSYSESSIPVLDSGNHILGVITLESLLEAVDDEMGDDYAKLGGLSEEEDLHEPLFASLKSVCRGCLYCLCWVWRYPELSAHLRRSCRSLR